MCGRYALRDDVDQLIREFVAAGGRPDEWRPEGWQPTYSIAPTTWAPIVRERVVDDERVRELTLAQWDWERKPSMPRGGPIINATIEKLDGSFWGAAFSSSRCIVPMTGYFEWTGEKGDKTPHFLHADGTLAAAGLTWSFGAADGTRRRAFVVVTREARDASGEIHDRMPAFVDDELLEAWLSPVPLTIAGDAAASRRRRAELLEQLDVSSAAIASTIRTHVVDRRVNNSRSVDRYDSTILDPVPAERD